MSLIQSFKDLKINLFILEAIVISLYQSLESHDGEKVTVPGISPILGRHGQANKPEKQLSAMVRRRRFETWTDPNLLNSSTQSRN